MQGSIIIVDGKPLNMTEEDTSLLDVFHRNGIDVQAHCKNGYCGACRTQCIKGSVDYHIDPLAFIKDNEILPCSCLPLGNIELTTTSAITG